MCRLLLLLSTAAVCCNALPIDGKDDIFSENCADSNPNNGLGYLLDLNDCSRFYSCVLFEDGKYLKTALTCPIGTYWDQSLWNCVEAKPARCRLMSTSGAASSSRLTTPYPSTRLTTLNALCNKRAVVGTVNQYDRNTAGVWSRISCDPGTVFNVLACACILQLAKPVMPSCQSDPFLHFPFDDDMHDVSCTHAWVQNFGPSSAVTITSSVGPNQACPKNKCAYFDGTGRLGVPYLQNWFRKDVSAFSVAFWFKKLQGGGVQGLINNGDCGEDASFDIHLNRGGMLVVGLATEQNDFQQLTDIQVEDGYWYHTALVYDGTTLVLYLNGKLQDSTPLTGAIENGQCPLTIGHTRQMINYENAGFFKGYIDELRIYERALTAQQVEDLYLMS